MVAKIVWSDPALEDLRGVAEWIAQDNPSAAFRVGAGLIEAVESLQHFPLMAKRLVTHDRQDIREFVHPPYRVFYSFSAENSVVTIIRVWHAALGEPGSADLT